MPYLNTFTCCGHVAAPPLFETDKGERTKFRVALNKPGVSRAYYIDCVFWGPAAEPLFKSLHQGDEIFLTGELETSVYKDARDSWHKSVCLRVEKYSVLTRVSTIVRRSAQPLVE